MSAVKEEFKKKLESLMQFIDQLPDEKLRQITWADKVITAYGFDLEGLQVCGYEINIKVETHPEKIALHHRRRPF
jgi:hypothetical protein